MSPDLVVQPLLKMTALDGRFFSESVMGWWSCDTFPEEVLEAQWSHGLGVQAAR